jgi:nucleoside-triphosphatase THEP1
MQPRIIIVTSPKHTGKSSLIARYAQFCGRYNLPVAGILAEGLWENSQRSGFTLVDLSSGVRVPLAYRSAPHGRARICFDFFPQGIAAALSALDVNRCVAANPIVVDEVGKLELLGKGWAPVLPPLLGLTGKTHIWAVRSSLVEAVIEHWGFTPRAVVDSRSPDALNNLINACGLF